MDRNVSRGAAVQLRVRDVSRKEFMRTDLQQDIQFYEKLWSSLNSGFANRPAPRNDPKRLLLFSYLDLCIEHVAGINLLVRNDLIGTALALHRPILEIHLRSAWLTHCATPQQIEQVIIDPDFKFPNDMTKQIDTAVGTQMLFRNFKSSTWSTLCGLTHSGIEQLCARVTDADEIGPNFSYKNRIFALHGASCVLISVAFTVAASCGSPDQKDIVLSCLELLEKNGS